MKRLLRFFQAKEFKPLYSPIFVSCCILFVAHQLAERILHHSMPFVDSYLDNLLSTPILLTLLLVERRTLFRYGRDYTMSVQEVCLATLVIAVAGEILFPALSDKFTRDYLDVVFYSLGSAAFYLIINKTPRTVT